MRTPLAIVATLALAGLAFAPVATRSVSPDAGRYVEVTFDGALTQAHRDDLAAVGAAVVTYAHDQRYRVWIEDPADVAAIDGVVDVRDLTADELVDDRLAIGVTAPMVVRVVDASLTGVRSAAATVGTVLDELPVRELDGLTELIILAPTTVAPTLAAMSGVTYVGAAPVALEVEGEATGAVLARLVASGNDAFFGPDPTFEPRYEEWLAELGIDGSGVNVSIVDTGIDEEHPDLDVAATVDYSLGEPVDIGGHGTHVAGIVAGTGQGVPDPLAADLDGFQPGMGVAPGAGLVNQNIIGRTTLSSHVALFEQAVQDAIDNGANIWNASWTSGEGTNAGYLSSAARLDALVRDGSAADGVQPFVMAFSAGNSGSDESTLTAPKEAKNLIVVASVDSPTNNPALGYSNDPRNITSFSSRGPTVDGRIGPTVAAPGADVRSTRSFAGQSCNTPVHDVAPGLYAYCSGTSMASPHVAGSVALLTQWWREGQGAGADPSAALAKALLVNSAVDLMFPDIPNVNEGWGRVDLDALFRPTGARLVEDGGTVLTDPGDAASHVVRASGDEPLRVTVAWDDVPGDPAAERAIVNDLDLVVTAPDGTVYVGNDFDRGWSTTGGAPDRLEVLENVYVQSPQAGEWLVEVRAHALPADGALGRGDGTDQHFALVVSGLS